MNDNNKKDKTDYIKGNFKLRVLDISKLVCYIYIFFYIQCLLQPSFSHFWG